MGISATYSTTDPKGWCMPLAMAHLLADGQVATVLRQPRVKIVFQVDDLPAKADEGRRRHAAVAATIATAVTPGRAGDSQIGGSLFFRHSTHQFSGLHDLSSY